MVLLATEHHTAIFSQMISETIGDETGSRPGTPGASSSFCKDTMMFSMSLESQSYRKMQVSLLISVDGPIQCGASCHQAPHWAFEMEIDTKRVHKEDVRRQRIKNFAGPPYFLK